MTEAYVLLADITGSTNLYEQLSQRDALDQISHVLGRMREIVEQNKGHCVKSQGDDTLNFFMEPDPAFIAAQAMVAEDWPYGLAIHAGISFGEILSMDNDIYGDTVNTAARLASLAKPGEVLIGDQAFDGLLAPFQLHCVSMGQLKLKGKNEATRVYSFTAAQSSSQTVVMGAEGPDIGRRTESAEFQLGNEQWVITDGQSLTLGRSDECDIVVDSAWVSRQHGRLALRESQLEYTDHSSSGSSVLTADGQEFQVHRRATLLNGEGTLLLGTRDKGETSSALSYTTYDLVPD